MDKKTFAVAEVKATESANPNGEFEVILSAETVDRDGEIIDAKAFEPLPESIPFHAFHDFNDPIGRATPWYDGDVLKARGTYASTARAQEIRTLVAEGVIGHTSVGFMAAVRAVGDDDPTPHVISGELLEGSFVSVPSNREAAVLVAKGYDQAATSNLMGGGGYTWTPTTATTTTWTSGKAPELLDLGTPQELHDRAVAKGAKCAHTDDDTPAPVPPSDEDGKAPASAVVGMARVRAAIARAAL